MGLGDAEVVPRKQWPVVQKRQRKVILKDDRSLFHSPEYATEDTRWPERQTGSRSLAHGCPFHFLKSPEYLAGMRTGL